MGRPQQSGKSCKRWRRGISRGTPESAHKKNHPRECGSVQADIALRISQAGVCQHSTVTSEPRSFLGGPAELPFSELEVGEFFLHVDSYFSMLISSNILKLSRYIPSCQGDFEICDAVARAPLQHRERQSQECIRLESQGVLAPRSRAQVTQNLWEGSKASRISLRCP